MTRFLSVTVSVCLAAAVTAAPGDDKKPSAADAERLVQQLGSAKHADREAAARALDALGSAALPALRDGAKSSDAEISRRAGELLGKLDRQSESVAALAPTKVHLKATNMPFADVVRDLGKQSKMRFQIAREPVDLAGRRVTIDTGTVGVWEALDALCRAAKVSIRPPTLDPDGTDHANPVTGVIAAPAAAAPVPNAAGGMAVLTIASSRPSADEPLVLQDGSLPECPTAILGAVRLRLIPDRWVNRDRKAGEEMRWTMEILTEPRVQWVTRPSFRFNAVPGLRADATPKAGGDANAPGRIGMSGSGVMRIVGDVVRGPTRHELPVYVKADGHAVGPVELTGALAGTVQAAAGPLVTLVDVTKEKATVATKDGMRMTIREYQRADDGAATLKVEVERPGGSGGSAMSTVSRKVKRGGANGVIPTNIVRAMTGVNGTVESFQLTDEKGRPFDVAVTRAEVKPRDGTAVGTFTLECEPPAGTGAPKSLALTGPRQVTVEVAFTLRGVPGG